jgi:hypothetical protein
MYLIYIQYTNNLYINDLKMKKNYSIIKKSHNVKLSNVPKVIKFLLKKYVLLIIYNEQY